MLGPRRRLRIRLRSQQVRTQILAGLLRESSPLPSTSQVLNTHRLRLFDEGGAGKHSFIFVKIEFTIKGLT